MIQAPLEVYRIDMKCIRNLHNIDDRVLSVSPQIGKDERPFLGVVVICNEHKYCVPLSKQKKKELLIKELEWCNEHARDLTNTANVLYAKYVSGEKFAARVQCLDFKRMEIECKKFSEKKK
ncbi:MAG: type III toxin-antitoxin system ToxN/AbiQ family toxin [Lachnospiraceae bacterium]|nr:type III toxin-antitoxin system ToxN/AbiQ family toxin [Lachnospiraceae bacterium]